MLSALQGTALDRRVQSHDHVPDYKVLLFSRWLDSDNAIIRGTFVQTPVDITDAVLNGSLSLDIRSDASSLNLVVSLEKLPIGVFYNCIVQLAEGDAKIDPSEWPTTFTGWHVGQPSATEDIQDKITTPSDGKTRRGSARTANISFISRDTQYTEWEITSDGVWFPNQKENPDQLFQFRNNYDNIGDIAAELATNPEWGMGLEADEVLIGPLPYRIEKQLQFVQITPMEALKKLGQLLHLVPQFNGEGKLRFVSRRIDDPISREVSGLQIAEVPMSATPFDSINAVIAIGFDKDLTEIVKPQQRLLAIQATFGFFDPTISFEGPWGGDEQESYRVKVGTVVDGNGATVVSPTIKNFRDEGLITTVDPPKFDKANEFSFKVSVENDTLLVIGLLVAFFAAYVGLIAAKGSSQETILTTSDLWLLTHTHGGAGTPPVTFPPTTGTSWSTSTALDLAAQALLIGGLFVLQQIGNFEFEIHGVPFETVYKELRVDALLENFGSQIAGTAPFRQWERRDEEITNYIFSTVEDSTVPAIAPTHPETLNPGLRSFARQELAIRLAEQAVRSITLKRDILLEPGDIIAEEETGFIYKIKTLSRTIARGTEPMMSVTAFRVK